MNECSTCHNKFHTKSSLLHHEKTAKYCLKLRGENASLYKCVGCKREFTRKYTYDRHKRGCVPINEISNYKQTIIELKTEVKHQTRTIINLRNQISSLQDKLVSIAEKASTKPTTINNRINNRINKQVNQLLPLTQEYIESQVPHLTIDHIKRGAQGYADFALEYALKDRIMCTDFSRRRGKYKDENGNVIDDPEMKKVSKKFFQAIHDHNTTLTNQYGQELYNKLTAILQNAGDELTQKETDKLQLTQQRILQEISKVNTSRIDVTDIAKGNKSDLLPEFVKEVCALSS